MNDLDDRLAAWNPVRAEDVLQASSSADAARMLHHILDQPVMSPPQRHAHRWSWQARGWIAAAAAAVVAIAGIVAHQSNTPTVSAGHRVVGFQHGPSLGVVTSPVELVDYATRSAALAPVFVPGPRDWEYFEKFYGRGSAGGADGVGDAQTWQQVGTYRFAASWHHGKLIYGIGGGPGAQLTGWPGSNWTNMYQYLASLPPQPTALRKLILVNNHGNPGAAFTAIEGIFGNFPVSARFQAELYAVLVSLPGVKFTRHAVDAAGRPGVGLWYLQDDYLAEIIVNPRTYVYMGGLSIAGRGDLSYGALLADPSRGTTVESVAILNSGIVGRLGQVP
jgi:hypothetical protein